MVNEKIAFVTYNTVGDGEYKNGIIKGRDYEITLFQDPEKVIWRPSGDMNQEQKNTKQRAQLETIDSILSEFPFEKMDHVYLYIGKKRTEDLIKRTAELSPEQITYVTCGCDFGRKNRLIGKYGCFEANVIRSDCGGRNSMMAELRGKIAELESRGSWDNFYSRWAATDRILDTYERS